jgi:hypothetical protein
MGFASHKVLLGLPFSSFRLLNTRHFILAIPTAFVLVAKTVV